VSKKRIGLYPGTFDPVTLGHLDIVKRAVKLVDHLVIGLGTGSGKTPLFSLEERIAMWKHEAEPLAAEARETFERVGAVRALERLDAVMPTGVTA